MIQTPRQLHSSLRRADAPSWHDEPHYSPPLAGALVSAYGHLTRCRSDPDRYRRAYAAVSPYRTRPMSVHQRQHVDFVLAQAYAAEGEYLLALECADAALDIAEHLYDRSAQVELAYLAAAASHAQVHHADAQHYYLMAISNLRALADRVGPADVALELDLLIRLASVDFEMARFEATAHHLEEANDLLMFEMPIADREVALLAWIGALLDRWRGEPGRALDTALQAAQALAQVGSLADRGRIQLVVADIALDLVEQRPAHNTATSRAPTSCAPTDLVALAERAAHEAAQLTRQAGDLIGAELAALARFRCRRIGRRAPVGTTLIRSVARAATRLEDTSLLGLAYTSQGDDFAARRDYECARGYYRQAIDVLTPHGLRALALLAQRALLHVNGLDTL